MCSVLNGLRDRTPTMICLFAQILQGNEANNYNERKYLYIIQKLTIHIKYIVRKSMINEQIVMVAIPCVKWWNKSRPLNITKTTPNNPQGIDQVIQSSGLIQ